MASAKSQGRLKKLVDERAKQVTLYNSIPNKRDDAAKAIVSRIQKIDSQIETIQQEATASSGLSLWFWLATALVAGGVAWAGVYFGSKMLGF